MRLLAAVLFTAAALAQKPQNYEASHEHLRGYCMGRLTVDEKGIAFQSAKKQKHVWRWDYVDIQQIKVLDNGNVFVRTYQSNQWRLGADREFHFRVTDKEFAPQVGPWLEQRVGPRFVSGLADSEVKPRWELPVKHRLRFSGAEGMLLVTEDRIVYRTEKPGDSRTWRLADIDSISSSGPRQLTITSYEHALAHHGDLKGFNFQLKEPLSEERYNDLWRRLEKSKGLQTLAPQAEENRAR